MAETSSRARYRQFVNAYAGGTLDDEPGSDTPGNSGSTADDRTARRRSYLRQYATWLRPHLVAITALFLLALVVAVLELAEPLFTRYIIDKVLLDTGATAVRLSRLQTAGLGFLAVILASNLLGALKDYRQRALNTKVILTLRRALFDRLLHLPLPVLQEMKTGGILSRLTGDIDTTTGLLQLAIMSPLTSLIRLVVAICVLFSLNWRLALTALALVPGVMLISFLSARRIRPIYRSIRRDAEEVDGRVGETFSGIRVVRAFRRETRELLSFTRGRHGILRKELFAQRREMLLWTSWGLILGLVNVAIVWYGGVLYLRGGATVGDILAFQWYTFLLLNPVWQLVNSFSELQRSLAAMERVFALLLMPADKPDRPGAAPAPPRVHALALDQVSFAYATGRRVLHEVSVTVPRGMMVALVGRSGAGKTTVTDLVARFHDPVDGRVLLNGIDLRDLQLASYRDLIAIVPQDIFLFDGSVRDNIAYGRHDATDADIEAAARRANAHEFIERLHKGYDTTVGERGVKLSGGQCQRLAIARALLKAPQILILDEATSNLDTESEQLIQGAMAGLLADRITFVIAHRLSTVRRAGLILLLDDGVVTERGTHDELMACGGAYRAMVERQMMASAADMQELSLEG